MGNSPTGKRRSRRDKWDLEQASEVFVQRWSHLISTTNWEKGKIICQWRDQLLEAGAEADAYTDEAWSQRVGGVSAQHVGRLRRVYDRFGQQWQAYEGLFWSHFLGAVDWPDAEMWLEGAVQNGWTVAAMRHQRWETLGKPPASRPRPEDVVAVDLDEDVVLDLAAGLPATLTTKRGRVRDPGREESFAPDFGSEPAAGPLPPASSATLEVAAVPFKPFAELAELPEDLATAFESFKLAILRHKADGWREVARDDLLATLEALKELALAR
ncbi:MAG: hypothetical protein GTO03_02200 [Planctomycetales bacterium]|nr:hypothetical protein [Planctomycetales bacterium]